MFKQGMKKASLGTVGDKVARLLFHYRITPHTTGLSPSEMLIGRTLRSRLDLLKSDVQQRVVQKQSKQKLDHDKHCKSRNFSQGECVGQEFWTRREMVLWKDSQKRPVTFEIALDNGRSCQRHEDHKKKSLQKSRVYCHNMLVEKRLCGRLMRALTVTQNK